MLSSGAARAGIRASAQLSRNTAVRTYAAAAQAQSVKPPVALFGIDGTYANALVCEFPAHPASIGCN